jgi:hypothetical protein
MRITEGSILTISITGPTTVNGTNLARSIEGIELRSCGASDTLIHASRISARRAILGRDGNELVKRL